MRVIKHYFDRVLQSPGLVSWAHLLTLSGLWVTIMLGLLSHGVPAWLGWLYLILVPTWAIWKKWRLVDLSTEHDPSLHQDRTDEGFLHVYATVRNNTGRTINNVNLKVDKLLGPDGEELRDYRGQRFDVAGTANRPYVAPDKSTRLHSDDEVRFKLVCVRLKPSSHIITAVTWRPKMGQTSQRDLRPGLIGYDKSPYHALQYGRYSLTVVAQGNNARGEPQTFEFWGTDNRAFFEQVSE